MALTVLQELIAGAIQGITEWLPISSSGALFLVFANFFKITAIDELLKITLFLHLGTFLSALIYFRKDVKDLFKSLFKYKKLTTEKRKELDFLIITTIITGIIGIFVLLFLENIKFDATSKTITLFVATLLLITGILQLKTKDLGLKKIKNITKKDSIITGLTQGASSFPGLSRSGLTVSTLLLLKFDKTTALKLSFLMSLPIVLGANIILNLDKFALTSTSIVGLISSFVFGISTIHVLMKISKKINFGWFVLIFSALTFLSVFFV